jgi:hypothetical protein
MMSIQWLTTNPNPRSPATGHDAGQTGWKMHAVIAEPSEKFSDIKYRRALCGLRARHGWGSDLFIEDQCARCLKALKRAQDQGH